MKKFNNLLFLTKGVMDHNEPLAQSIHIANRNQAKLTGLVTAPHLPDDMHEYQEHYEGSLIESLPKPNPK